MKIIEQIKNYLGWETFPLAAFDLTDYSLEILQLNESKEVTAYCRKDLEKGLINNGNIKNIKALCQIIKKQFTSNDFKGKSCILSLPDKETFFLFLKIHGQNNLLPALIQAAQEKLPLDIKDCYYDYILTNQKEDYKEIFFVAAKKQIIDQYVQIFNTCDLSLKLIDFESACLARAIFKEKLNEPVFIVDIGAKTADVVLLDKKGFRDQINVPIAGDDLTKKIAEVFSVSIEEADKYKIKKGLTSKEKNIDQVLKKLFEEIIFEISQIRVNYEQQNNNKVKKIVFTGGTANMPGLIDYFSEIFTDVKIEKAQLSQKYNKARANVIGLALRGLNNKTINQGINLLKNINN